MISIEKRATLLNCSTEQSTEIHNLLTGIKQPSEYPKTAAWLNQCCNVPPRHEQLMEAFNEILGGYGVEMISEQGNYHNACILYVNMGDTYIPTACYHGGKYKYRSWGDVVEQLEAKGITFN